MIFFIEQIKVGRKVGRIEIVVSKRFGKMQDHVAEKDNQ
jgi:hypothetical protein